MSYETWSITSNGVKYNFDDVEVTNWDVAGRDFRIDDADRPREDGRFFGIDYVNPGDVEIDLIIRARGKTRQDRFEAASAIRGAFDTAWNADPIRLTNGATSELVIAGRVMVEGRPRHVDWDDSRATFGIIRGTALFVRATSELYAVDEDGNAGWRDATLMLVASQIGGLKDPLKAPLRTSVESTRAAPIEVGGTAPAWPVIEMTGPIQSNAQVEVPGRWRVYLNRALAWNQTARIDTRPGRRATYLNDSPVQLLDPRSSLLSECSLFPGPNVVALRGASLEGTASVRLLWRDTKGNI